MMDLMQANADTDFTGHVAGAVRAEMARQRRDFVEVAQIIHVSRATAYRRINGESAFTVHELELIARELGIEVDDILASAEFGSRIAFREMERAA